MTTFQLVQFKKRSEHLKFTIKKKVNGSLSYSDWHTDGQMTTGFRKLTLVTMFRLVCES